MTENCVDPDQMLQYAPSDQGLHSLLRPVFPIVSDNTLFLNTALGRSTTSIHPYFWKTVSNEEFNTKHLE